ncbi:TPA: phage tail protein [Enterobacter cloacae]
MCNCFSKNLGLGEGSALPVGVPVPWPSATPPAGWLKCNGATFSAALYPKLALAYPSGILPDLRGEFIRGWDDGRGVDNGRALLSAQAHGIPKIYGYFQSYDAGGNEAPTGPFTQSTMSSAQYVSGTSAGTDERIFFDSTLIIPDAAEVRPRSIAFNYIVRAAQ